jgi:acetyl-CoA decarbonylase/synthase, CODH/ACS complex subunit delta
MGFEIPKMSYSGTIKTVTLGKGDKAVTVGGATAYPFHGFEGDLPNKTAIAMEVWDIDPTELWPPALLEPFKDVCSDPAAWAKKCVDEYGAQMIQVTLVGTDPNGQNLDAEHSINVVKAVRAAVDVPMTVWGTSNVEKDAEVLRAVAEAMHGEKMLFGPIQEGNYKQLGAAIIGFDHIAVNNTPIDINLAKQLNVLTGNLGVPDEKIMIDPTTGGLGYGLEYSYSVMERARMAALVQQDEKLQFPLYCSMAQEVWKVKEARIENDAMGEPKTRGVLMEAITATSLLLAGADVLVMRHPDAIKQIREFIDGLS